MRKFNFGELKGRVSWGSVFGGVVTVLAVSVLLSLLSSSIGLFMFDPLANHPTSGIGTEMGIWTAVSLVISMFAGGFVAGKLAGVDGMIHGFLVWATTLIVAAILAVMLMVGATKMAVNALGSVTSMAGSVISGAGSVAGSSISALSDQAQNLFGDIDINADVNDDNVPQQIREALIKSGVKELQPGYLKNQLQAVKSDLGKSVKKAIAAPEDADNVMSGFMDRLQQRADKIADNIDRNDLVNAVANNTSLTRAEADKAVTQYTDMINKAAADAKQLMNNLKQDLQNAVQEWKEIKHDALVMADEATDTAAWSTLIAFFAILVGAVLSVAAGNYGGRKTQELVDM